MARRHLGDRLCSTTLHLVLAGLVLLIAAILLARHLAPNLAGLCRSWSVPALGWSRH
ncbi:hypothetical protein I4I73_24440 [Pseudonocardia sp. KRD-184]|uniref:Uncharacterized protein n=1 Tax=Pseudonocardia oceani TaxID=2792013 RepID=A0ABS6U395_9PSEU|nr:hypothetical protein [Pseudonocardia oceani]MBW0092371.1 hypothetical protein [Pseudonocardia oceani]MBW0099146.1 hypothetical protein [Pseudonocardia oceani]MBW0125461.1 hypothetical protein [Pseudonocardia oceani]MBW0126619.1 hypothetical protein [Pseudonocardia oceani]